VLEGDQIDALGKPSTEVGERSGEADRSETRDENAPKRLVHSPPRGIAARHEEPRDVSGELSA
jgi:hypothetical protein